MFGIKRLKALLLILENLKRLTKSVEAVRQNLVHASPHAPHVYLSADAHKTNAFLDEVMPGITERMSEGQSLSQLHSYVASKATSVPMKAYPRTQVQGMGDGQGKFKTVFNIKEGVSITFNLASRKNGDFIPETVHFSKNGEILEIKRDYVSRAEDLSNPDGYRFALNTMAVQFIKT